MAGMGLSQNLLPVKPNLFEYVNDREYGYTTMEVSASQLRMRFFSDVDGGLRDDFVILKNH